MDKLQFQDLAERFGFAVPRVVRVDATKGAQPARDLRYPCILKPAYKSTRYAEHFAKAYRVNSPEEVAALWSKIKAVMEEIIVQEWIEGTDSDVYFCLQYRPATGRMSSYVGRKTCQWPPLVGGTATCAPAPEVQAQLAAVTDDFFTRVGFVGLGSMEFKRDLRDGRYYLIEPTVGRTDYQEEIATLNGVNLPVAAYFGEQGMAPPDCRAPERSRAWRDPLGHANAIKAGAADPVLDIATGIDIVDAYFRLGDPFPYLQLKRQALSNRVARLIRRRP
jgi:predicted ATP-grasp superfamily ATP-dependent carboligase